MSDSEDHQTVVVGIGASAGGLNALRVLLSTMTSDSGLAYVVVVHLSPDHESHLADLLGPHCPMPVRQVTEDVSLEPDHVYLIAPGRQLSTIDSHLRVSALEPSGPSRAPIDHFFRTLAETHGDRAIGVVMTGTGSDGTAGLEVIKDRGGLTIVQDPVEAEFDGMPRSAILSGYVDRIAPIAEIFPRILAFARTSPEFDFGHDEELPPPVQQALAEILGVVRTQSGHDMRGYKHSTLLRRLRRRMQLHGCERLDQYLEILRLTPDEAKRLFEDLLISVTNFFRDPAVFDHLETDVIPAILSQRGHDDTVRVWSVGCSTGEEAYSLAILLLEATSTMAAPPTIQVFATDLHDVSLRRAREGRYPEMIGADLSEERLRRFFVRETDGFRVRKEVREMVVFAPHDLLRDPPFSHIDLVSCRNLLIYLQRDLQRRVIELFHYALDPGGALVLGTSESLDRSDLFAAENKSLCIFRRRDVHGPDPRLPVFSGLPTRSGIDLPVPSTRQRGFGPLHERVVERHAPPSVLVNEDLQILHYSERAGRFLTHPGGDPTTDIVRLVRPELRIELRAALFHAKDRNAPASSRPVTMDFDGEPRDVVVRVRPAPDDPGLLLVIFDDVAPLSRSAVGSSGDHGPVATELETELDLTKQRLQALIEEYEMSQEEMKAANEELQSTNEELRSTLEELETSKEELQSVNEELTTLNQENHHKVEEFRMLSDDLQNLLVGTDIATLFLDRQRRIMRFTPRIGELFNIRPSDRGRPLSDLTHQLRYESLDDDAQTVLDRLVPIEREIQSHDDRWFLGRVLPYRSSDDHIDGLVINFIDITRRRQAELALRDSEQRLRLALAASRMGAWSLDLASDEVTVDDRVIEVLGISGRDVPRSMTDLVEEFVHVEDRPVLSAALTRSSGRSDAGDFSLEVRLVGTGERWVLVSGRGYTAPHDPDHVGFLTGTMLDVSDRKATEQSLSARVEAQTEAVTRTERRYRALVEASSQIVWTADSSGHVVDDPPQWRAFTGQSETDLHEHGWLAAVHPDDRVSVERSWLASIGAGEPFHDEFQIRHAATDSWHWVSMRAVPVAVADDRPAGWIAMIADIDERRRANEEVRALASTLTMAEHEERRRISRILHDDLQQRLYSAQMRILTLADDIEASGPGELTERLGQIEAVVADSVEVTRHLAVELSPPILEHEGLTETLGWLAGEMAEMHGLHVELRSDHSHPIDDHDMRVFLFQLTRELLFNVVKHAGVDHAVVALSSDAEALSICVSDDGNGFAPEEAIGDGAGLGLSNANERLRLFGGSMDVESVPGDGASVTITLPITSRP